MSLKYHWQERLRSQSKTRSHAMPTVLLATTSNQSSSPPFLRFVPTTSPNLNSKPTHFKSRDMDYWRVAVLGDGGVGKTALAVQVMKDNLLVYVRLLTLSCSSPSIASSVSMRLWTEFAFLI
jgi:hypothetical protein